MEPPTGPVPQSVAPVAPSGPEEPRRPTLTERAYANAERARERAGVQPPVDRPPPVDESDVTQLLVDGLGAVILEDWRHHVDGTWRTSTGLVRDTQP